MPTPRQQLEHIIRTAQSIHENWHHFAETTADLAHAGDRLGIHGGDTPDPTIAGVYANERTNEITAAIAEALGALTEAERKMTGIVRHHPETARQVDAAIKAARCSDPVCEGNAVKDGHCFTHWQQHRNAS